MWSAAAATGDGIARSAMRPAYAEHQEHLKHAAAHAYGWVVGCAKLCACMQCCSWSPSRFQCRTCALLCSTTSCEFCLRAPVGRDPLYLQVRCFCLSSARRMWMQTRVRQYHHILCKPFIEDVSRCSKSRKSVYKHIYTACGTPEHQGPSVAELSVPAVLHLQVQRTQTRQNRVT